MNIDSRVTYQNVGEYLITAIPEFKDLFEEHLKDYDQCLPHPLFGDFTRFFIEVYRSSKNEPEKQRLLRRCSDIIEQLLLSKDKKLSDLALVSFLENLHQAGNDYEAVKRALGKEATKQLKMIENWTPNSV